MTDHDDLGPGEIRRGFERIERQLDAMQKDVKTRYDDLANKINAAFGPVSELRYRCEQQEKDVTELAGKVREVERSQNMNDVRSASIAGGMAVLLFLAKFLLLGK